MSSPSPSPSDYESADSHQERPNRWQGSARTWQNITSSDRAIATSLTTARDRDLSIHLYNAHSLKRKARESEQLDEDVVVNVLEDTKGFVPPRAWVAWPLKAEDVPRDVGGVNGYVNGDGLGRWTFRRRVEGEGRSGEILGDVLAARTLRFAKERFEKRMRLVEEGEEEGDGDEAQEDFEEDDEENSDTMTQSQVQRKGKRSRRHETPEMIPVMSADDDHSRTLLRPTINHTLTKLDDLLMALHHARSACLQVAQENSDAEEEIQSGRESVSTPVKKAKGRPPKHVERMDSTAAKMTAAEILAKFEKRGPGRPRKEIPRFQGETDEEYVIRLARLRKVPLPPFAVQREVASPSVEPVTPTKAKASRLQTNDEEDRTLRRIKKLELRDWSEILGAAALVGFDPNVLKRATQRCANLFGEGMSFHSILETPFGETRDLLQPYKPDLIPGAGLDYPLDYKDVLRKEALEDTTSHAAGADALKGLDSRNGCTVPDCPRSSIPFRDTYALQRHMRNSHKTMLTGLVGDSHDMKERSSHDISSITDKNWLCPYEECGRSTEPFKTKYSLQRHMQRKHAVFEDESDDESENVVPSDEEMDSGVHVDGFLKPFNYPLKTFETTQGVKKPRRMATRTSFVARDEYDEESVQENMDVDEGDQVQDVEDANDE